MEEQNVFIPEPKVKDSEKVSEGGDLELGLRTSSPVPPDNETGGASGAGTSGDEPLPPAYDEIPKDTPPSYSSIFSKIKEAKKDSSTPIHFLGTVIGILLSTIAVTICMSILMAVPIAMVVVGAVYKNECPVEPKIPIYLIVSGSFHILKSIIDLIVRCRKKRSGEEDDEETGSKIQNAFNTFLGCFLFGFFIAGNVWIYSNYPPSDNPSDTDYCHGTLYYFAFWIMTSGYIILGLFFVFICCACCAGCAAWALKK